MLDNNGAPVAEPEVVEVDNINEAPEDATIDEQGHISRYHDEKTNKVFIRKGSAEHEAYLASKAAPEVKTEENTSDQDSGESTGDEGQEDKAEGGEPEGDSDGDSFYNPADYVLKTVGHEDEEIEIDGQKVKIADLTPEQQLAVIVDEFDAQRDALATEIQKLKTEKPAYAFKDPKHKEVIDFLEKGGSLTELGKHLMSNDPSARAKMLSDDEVVKLSIKKAFGDAFSDEDVEAEFKEMTDGAKARRAKAFRVQMEKEQPEIGPLSAELEKRQKEQELVYRREFDTEATKLKTSIDGIKEIGGIVIPDKVKEYLKAQTIPSSFDKNSKFVDEIRSKPELLAELKFWQVYGKELVKNAKEQGMREAAQKFGKEGKGLDDKPRRSYQTAPANNEPAKPKNVLDMSDNELDRLLSQSNGQF